MEKTEIINELRLKFLEYEQEWDELKKEKESLKESINSSKADVITLINELDSFKEIYEILKAFPELKKKAKKAGIKSFALLAIFAILTTSIWGPSYLLTNIVICALELTVSGFASWLVYYSYIMHDKDAIKGYSIETLEKDLMAKEEELDLERDDEYTLTVSLKQVERKEQELIANIKALENELNALLDLPKSKIEHTLYKANVRESNEEVVTRVREKLIQGVE